MNTDRRTAPKPPIIAFALVADALFVVLFAALGRSSHAREATFVGLVETAWPFLVGLAVVWLAARVWRAPLRIVRSGVPLWVGTVAIGMLLRALTGAGTAMPFVIVATVSVGVFLLGWRGIAVLFQRALRR
ncbi:DUF3054 domain-containing protein [Leucobacter sp. CSA1]|uniref:DUF3054 domain-containing protein n=1 Tax=Leucobacter chromiisoli TaxID=2796471 RepID=A0A934UVY5_9MICO|nr:DUF3054 domain-containing protein [Leucobacter chromiisoli]MBK0419372.1 DUF3054 domain-containing protein [Leucobacter chromiisoli]